MHRIFSANVALPRRIEWVRWQLRYIHQTTGGATQQLTAATHRLLCYLQVLLINTFLLHTAVYHLHLSIYSYSLLFMYNTTARPPHLHQIQQACQKVCQGLP